MLSYAPVTSRPLALARSTESVAYGLLALALGWTALGVFLGMRFAPALLSSGVHVVLLVAELVLVFTARLWMDRAPLNYLLFALFPVLSGITVTPYLLFVLAGYANGGTILLNAAVATGFMAAAAAVFARTTPWDLGVLGRGLFFALLGLVAFALLQIFVPALRTTRAELMISGAGIAIFGLFTAYDLQRISALGRAGANPFLLALSLYLDIFNLFLYILRFMLAFSGNRR